MTDNKFDIGRAAVAAALARAGRRASTAAAIAAIVPLAMMATAPPAAAIATVGVTVAGDVTASGGNFNYAYTFTSAAGSGQVTRIELPEIHADEFLTGSGGSFLGSIPQGWTVGQQLSSAFGSGGATFKAPNHALAPGAFIELVSVSGTEGFLGNGSSQTFTLESAFSANVASNAEIRLSSGLTTSIDPPTPDPVPEPASLALLGMALTGLAGLRRRRKA